MTAYDTAPDLYDEQQELMRTMARLPLREKLLRLAALADRSTLGVPEADGKALQSIRSAALNLAGHDQAHGTAAGPVAPAIVRASASLGALRAYVRQEYGAWQTTASAARPLNNPRNPQEDQ